MRSMPIFFMTLIFLLTCSYQCVASDVESPKIGNFILPYSQQPGPLIGFGENILQKQETQVFLYADDFDGVNKYFTEVIPAVLYGITDNFSLFINVPIATRFKIGNSRSSGFEDVFAQLEYAFYTKATYTYSDEATIVGNVAFPTGSINKNPATGYGSYSFFLGTTFNRTYVDWFYFASPGAILTTARNGTKTGNTYLYEGGFGRNILAKNGWILAWMVEADGIYTQKDRVKGQMDPDSGGNVVYVVPSFWASTRRFILQVGAGVPVAQRLNGSQTQEAYLVAVNVGWSFF